MPGRIVGNIIYGAMVGYAAASIKGAIAYYKWLATDFHEGKICQI